MSNIINLFKRLKTIILPIINSIRVTIYIQLKLEDHLRKKFYSFGENNRIFTRHFGSEPYLIKIGNHCTISGGVKFTTHDGGSWIFRDEIPDLNVFGKIEIKDNCFIGMDTIILPNVTIGPNSVVGAGSVVSRDVPPNTVVAGVPAKIISSVEEYKKNCLTKWKSLNITGPREKWKKQLIEHFWEK